MRGGGEVINDHPSSPLQGGLKNMATLFTFGRMQSDQNSWKIKQFAGAYNSWINTHISIFITSNRGVVQDMHLHKVVRNKLD